jgi:transposase
MSLTDPSIQVPPTQVTVVTGGVDTHQLIHHAGVLDADLNRVADKAFPATEAGYRALVDWMSGFGLIAKIGVESTGSYGAGLARFLTAAGLDVVEVSRPEKSTRVREGKSDAIDAYSAARQAATGAAQGLPKTKTGVVEAIRTIKVPRDEAVKHRTAAYCQLRDLITTAPAPIHDQLITMTGYQRVQRALGYRPDPAHIEDPLHACKHALRALARRIQALTAEIEEADKILVKLTRRHLPTLLAMRQVGPQTAARLALTAGQNLDRMGSEAAFAKLCGVAPLPASSGKTNRHRLNRGGDRQANSALFLIIVGRMRNHPETITYVERRTAQGMSKKAIIRCLKRHLARHIYRALKTDLMTP